MTLISRNFFEKFFFFLFLFIFLDVVAVLSSQAREKLSFWQIEILERATQILREINFGYSRSAESAILTHF